MVPLIFNVHHLVLGFLLRQQGPVHEKGPKCRFRQRQNCWIFSETLFTETQVKYLSSENMGRASKRESEAIVGCEQRSLKKRERNASGMLSEVMRRSLILGYNV